MSIRSYILELEQINTEIKRQSAQTRILRARSKGLEAQIIEYFNSKEQPGAKYGSTAVIVEHKPKRASKTKAAKEEDALRVLRDNGVRDARSVLTELMESSKGMEIGHQKLKIKKFKSDTRN